MNFYEFYFTGVDELYFKSFLLAQLDLYFQEDFLYVWGDEWPKIV